MTLIIIIRPEPGCTASVAAAHAQKLEALGFPLFATEAISWVAPEPETFDALLIGSGNALRYGGESLRQYAGKPAYAVGPTTAQAAQATGLAVVATGCGGLQALLARLAPGHRRLLRLSGRARVPLTPPPGTTLIERVVYDSIPHAMPHRLARLLMTHALVGTIVLLHSAEAARHFAAECDRFSIPRARLRIAALGPRIAEAAGSGWASVTSADTPNDAALLALVGQLCQNQPVSK